MKNIKTIIIILYLLILTGTGAVYGKPGTVSLQFFNIGIGARQTALGNTSCSLSDVNVIFSNPAVIGSIEKQTLSVSHNQWIAGITEQSAACILRTAYGNIGLGVIYLHMDEMTGYSVNDLGNPVKISDFTSYDLAGILSYSGKIEGIDGGVSLKVFQEKIEEVTAFSAALDLGLYKKINNISAGFSIMNIGPDIKFIDKKEKLPLKIKIGAGYRLPTLPLLITADLNKPNDDCFKFSAGSEYSIKKILDLRLGYNSGNDNGSGITAGVGINMPVWAVDYAFVPFGDLGDIHRISLSVDF